MENFFDFFFFPEHFPEKKIYFFRKFFPQLAPLQINNEIDKFKAYLQNECKVHKECIDYVNKTRLDMDAANGNYAGNETEANKMRADAATKEFESACAR